MKRPRDKTVTTTKKDLSLDPTINRRLFSLQEFVSEDTGIPIEEMCSKKRDREIVFSRQAYCYLAMKLIKQGDTPSLSVIGSLIEKDHATVLHSKKAIQNLIDTNKFIRQRMNSMEGAARKIPKIIKGVGEFEIKANLDREYPLEKELSVMSLFAFIEEPYSLSSGESISFPAGLKIEIPEQAIGIIRPSIGNDFQLLDNGEHDIYVILQNDKEFTITVDPNDEIGIFEILKHSTMNLVNNG